MTTSIVIPAFNGRVFLEAGLPAVMALKAGEVIVIDDASTDGSADFVARNFPQVKLIRHPHNTGFPKGVNDGFAAASGDIVFLLNQDAVPAPDLIQTTLPHFKNRRLFAVTFNDGYHGFAESRLEKGFVEYQNGSRQKPLYRSFWANGGSSAFRRQAWIDLGGFDTSFSPGYFEDLDLCWRAWRAGQEIFWAKGAKVSHPQPGSTFKKTFSAGQLQKIQDRNFLLAHWKNLDPGEFPAHIGSVFVRILNHPGYLVPLFMALPHLPHILSSRRPAKLTNSQVFTKLHEKT